MALCVESTVAAAQLPGAFAVQVELVAVEGGEGVAVADADQQGVGQLAAQQGVERLFQAFVHRRAGFVEEGHRRAVVEQAGEGQALLFTQGQDAAPVAGFVQAACQVWQADLFQHLLHTLAVVARFGGVGEGAAQVAQGQVGALGEEQRLVPNGSRHLAVGVGPETGEGA